MLAIREWDALSARQRAQAVSIDWSDGDAPSVVERIHALRIQGRRFQGYEALFALDRGIPVGKVGSIRLALRTPEGTETVCGIADVMTRPDATRRGVATLLLEESHRRARAEGIRWSFLWTKRSWGAHRAYERLGYEDVYSARVAIRKVPRTTGKGRLPAGYTVRAARAADAPALEGILERATTARLGFVPRAPNSFAVRFRLGWRQPKDYRILYLRAVPVAYAQAVRDRHDVLSREVVTTGRTAAALLLEHLQGLARGRWLGLGSTTFTRDEYSLLRRHDFEFIPRSHGVLMACPLTRAARARRSELARTIASPRFSLHGGDMF